MRPRAALAILIVAIVSIMGLIGLVVREDIARRNGTEVILRMEAVDPRDLLSGHYVTVSLSEPLAEGAACPPWSEMGFNVRALFKGRGQRWVAQASRGGYASLAGVADTQASALRLSRLTVRGEAWCSAAIPPSADATGRAGVVNMELGVPRFHVSQREATRIDQVLAHRRAGVDSPVAAIVSLGADGKARLKGLLVEGQRLELSLF